MQKEPTDPLPRPSVLSIPGFMNTCYHINLLWCTHHHVLASQPLFPCFVGGFVGTLTRYS